MSKVLRARPAENPISSKHHLNNAHDEFFRRPDRQQERHHRRCRGNGEPGDVLQPEGNGTHLAHKTVAVAEISERLNISSPKQSLRSGWIVHCPLLIEIFDISLGEQAIEFLRDNPAFQIVTEVEPLSFLSRSKYVSS